MRQVRECAICGAAYVNATKHQQFHDEVDVLLEAARIEGSESGGRRRSNPEVRGKRRGPG